MSGRLIARRPDECSRVCPHGTAIPAVKRFSYGRGWVRTSDLSRVRHAENACEPVAARILKRIPHS
jgi:hypothetical protein